MSGQWRRQDQRPDTGDRRGAGEEAGEAGPGAGLPPEGGLLGVPADDVHGGGGVGKAGAMAHARGPWACCRAASQGEPDPPLAPPLGPSRPLCALSLSPVAPMGASPHPGPVLFSSVRAMGWAGLVLA